MYHAARWVPHDVPVQKQLRAKVKLAAEDAVDGNSQVGQQRSCTGRLIRSAADKESKLEEASQE
jgi:hypothetical protein